MNRNFDTKSSSLHFCLKKEHFAEITENTITVPVENIFQDAKKWLKCALLVKTFDLEFDTFYAIRYHVNAISFLLRSEKMLNFRRFLILIVISSLTIFAFSINAYADITREEELIKRLSMCVDGNRVIVDKQCLRRTFFSDIGLTSGNIIGGQFGFNSSGRFFSFTVLKRSVSGGTDGLFEVSFYLERYISNENGTHNSIFEARNGSLFGLAPHDYSGLIAIYDLASGDYLVNNDDGKTVGSLDLPQSEQWSSRHTASNLINSGKTIGYIIEERLGAIERVGKGGRAYYKLGENRYRTFRNMDSPDKLIFSF